MLKEDAMSGRIIGTNIVQDVEEFGDSACSVTTMIDFADIAASNDTSESRNDIYESGAMCRISPYSDSISNLGFITPGRSEMVTSGSSDNRGKQSSGRENEDFDG